MPITTRQHGSAPAGGTGPPHGMPGIGLPGSVPGRGVVTDVVARVLLTGIGLPRSDGQSTGAAICPRATGACDRLELKAGHRKPSGPLETAGGTAESGTRGKAGGAPGTMAESFADSFHQARADREERRAEARPYIRRPPAAPRRRSEEDSE